MRWGTRRFCWIIPLMFSPIAAIGFPLDLPSPIAGGRIDTIEFDPRRSSLHRRNIRIVDYLFPINKDVRFLCGFVVVGMVFNLSGPGGCDPEVIAFVVATLPRVDRPYLRKYDRQN